MRGWKLRQIWARRFADDLPTPALIRLLDGEVMDGREPYARLVVGFEAGMEAGLDKAAQLLERLDSPMLKGMPALIRAIGTAKTESLASSAREMAGVALSGQVE